MPIEIEIDRRSIEAGDVLRVFKGFLEGNGNFYLTGSIIYSLYEKQTSLFSKLFNSKKVASIFIYENLILVKVWARKLDKVNGMLEEFADSREFIDLCKDKDFKIKIEVLPDDNFL